MGLAGFCISLATLGLMVVTGYLEYYHRPIELAVSTLGPTAGTDFYHANPFSARLSFHNRGKRDIAISEMHMMVPLADSTLWRVLLWQTLDDGAKPQPFVLKPDVLVERGVFFQKDPHAGSRPHLHGKKETDIPSWISVSMVVPPGVEHTIRLDGPLIKMVDGSVTSGKIEPQTVIFNPHRGPLLVIGTFLRQLFGGEDPEQIPGVRRKDLYR